MIAAHADMSGMVVMKSNVLPFVDERARTGSPGSRRGVFLTFSVLFILVLSASAARVEASLPVPQISLDRTMYNVGEPVFLRIRVLTTAPATISGLRLVFTTPGGMISVNVQTINSDTWYTLTVSTVAIIAGYYSVVAELPTIAGTQYSNTVTFVVQGAPFDFTMTITPTTQSVIQGDTATFQFSYTFSSPYFSGTAIYGDVSGLVSGMRREFKQMSEALWQILIYTSETTPLGTYPLTLSVTSRGVSRQASFTVTVVPRFDFSVSCSPSTQTVNIGDKNSYTVNVNLVSGTAAPVSLTVQGLPADVTYSFSPQTGTPSFTSTLTVEASPTASEGTYSITIAATSGTLSRTTAATLVLKKSDFTVSSLAQTVSVKQAEKTSINIAVNPVGSFDKLVTLSVTGLPSGASATFNTPIGKPPLVSTLTITASASTPEGSYTLTIDATAEGKTRSTTVTLEIQKGEFLQLLMANPTALALIGIVLAAVVVVLVALMRRQGKTVSAEPSPKPPLPSPTTITCPKCGSSNNPKDTFCTDCGGSLA